eukprot:TRINITY_DN1637_c0_g1_i1.p1 TRINITY_DN1637_c0_g1~~TRINITY_DN1637_c0_g1_i1.p1  ORF type:complete len:1101 (+),score=504.92 TRINITY_DN1637_c0_g1_i1:162-3305(+)
MDAAAAKPAAGAGTAKKDTLRSIEKDVQARWAAIKIWESDAPAENDPSSDNGKYMATFPYPYMNGRLHLGHCFTITKSEFMIGYQRLLGKKTLFPFGFHCTGMPIKACADRLKREMELYGVPPKFPEPEAPKVEDAPITEEPAAQSEAPKGGAQKKTKAAPAAKAAPKKKSEDPTAFHSSKSKANAKSEVTYQWNIMKSMGVAESEIPLFANPEKWLGYFPPIAIEDMNEIGVKVDWRRSFITTSLNPYYDSFVKWQFETLYDLQKIKFGKRYTIWSPIDGQPCLDHDRASGEKVLPQDYTLVKLKVIEPFPEPMQALHGKNVFLVPATLRPETMYGQTNCYILPEGNYGAFEINDSDVFICTERAAKNLSYQGFSKEFGKINCLATLKGTDLIGLPLKAPLAKYDVIYTLPMLTISTNKGTGVVTSVPSDSPDDFAALSDLKNKPALRTKFNLKDEWVMPFEPVPIIRTPKYGDLSALAACEEFGITTQNQKEKLELAKEAVYKQGFYEGVLIVGEHANTKVQDAKNIIRDVLIEKGEALAYSEPSDVVISRSGDECVVCLTDQWYITYGEANWRKDTAEALASLDTYGDDVRHLFEQTLDWMNQWACSRSFGLGSRLPCDPKYLIESLSDSTVYMAYYTVAHFLQGGTLEGSKVGPAGISADQLTRGVWDYLLLNKEYPVDSGISEEILKKLKREFNFWYPVDLRVSGKDLIPNHLTFYMYNHTAIFPKEHWPRSIKANGHILLNNSKMSKQTGNFLTLKDAVEKYSADATRIALADAGDGLEDANFSEVTANGVILRLYNQVLAVKKLLESKETMRKEGFTFGDLVFDSEINRSVEQAKVAYETGNFKAALEAAFWSLSVSRDSYKSFVGEQNQNYDILYKFYQVQSIILSPIAPHICEHIWTLLGNEGFVVNAKWPETGLIDEELLKQNIFLNNSLAEFRAKQILAEKPKGKQPKGKTHSATIFTCATYPAWQRAVLRIAASKYDAVSAFFFLPKTFLGSRRSLLRSRSTKSSLLMPRSSTPSRVMPTSPRTSSPAPWDFFPN